MDIATGQWENRFLRGMDQIVNEMQADAEMGIAYLKYIIAFFICLFLLFVFGLYKILVKPILKMVRALSNESEERVQQIKSILENTTDLIWSLDREYRLLTFNSAFTKAIQEETDTVPKIGEPIPLTGYSEKIVRKWKGFYGKVFSGESFVTQLEGGRQGRKSAPNCHLTPSSTSTVR